jgi:septal ring factor EnvC (AmiA/AmiB activator)
VPEISARDLRRLEALEGRLSKATEERRSLAEARRELRSALTGSERRVRALERERAAVSDQLEGVLAENQALAARLEEARADLDRLQAASLELRTQVDSAQNELKSAQEALATTEGKLADIHAERDDVVNQLKVANEQLAGKGITPVLPPAKVAELVDGFVGEFDRGLPGLALREGEVRLQVAFAQVGEEAGFVVPSPGAPAEVRENLHEVAVRFGRSIELPGAER